MKNNRKIEVGQMREIKSCCQKYVILWLNDTLVKVLILNGEDYGKTFYWNLKFINEDIVVM
jgi:hypothetical protein